MDSANLTRPKAHLYAHAHSVTGVQVTGDFWVDLEVWGRGVTFEYYEAQCFP